MAIARMYSISAGLEEAERTASLEVRTGGPARSGQDRSRGRSRGADISGMSRYIRIEETIAERNSLAPPHLLSTDRRLPYNGISSMLLQYHPYKR